MNTDSIVTDLITFPYAITLADGEELNPWKQFAATKVVLCTLAILDCFAAPPPAPRFFLSSLAHSIHNVMNIHIIYNTPTLTHVHHDKESPTILHCAIFASAVLSSIITLALMKINSMDDKESGITPDSEKLLKIAFAILLIGFSIITTSLANRDRFYTLKLNGQRINL